MVAVRSGAGIERMSVHIPPTVETDVGRCRDDDGPQAGPLDTVDMAGAMMWPPYAVSLSLPLLITVRIHRHNMHMSSASSTAAALTFAVTLL